MRVNTILKFVTLSVLFTLFVSVTAYSQTTGSISGSVVDETNKPLLGAVVRVLEKTGLGAETDENGEFVILNVDVGTYTVEITYTGYAATRKTDVRVSVDQRYKLGVIQLSRTDFTTEEIEVNVERSGIPQEQTGRMISQEQIENSGIRGITNLVSKTAGVVQDERGGQINIRGGRTSENSIIVDGVATTNPVDGSSNASVPNSLLQEISVLTGGFGAEYGNALSGVINVTTKSGTEVYSGSLEAQSDVLAGKWIKTTSQGYNLYNISFGGPLIPSKSLSRIINFYGSVERQYLGVANPSWIANELFEDGIIPNFTKNSWSYSGRLSINLSDLKKPVPINFRFGASVTNSSQQRVVMSFLKENSFRNPLENIDDNLFYGRITHNVSNKFFYELQANYYKSTDVLSDPFFQDQWFKYGDTNSVPGLAYVGPDPYQNYQGTALVADPLTGSVFRTPYSVYNLYDKKEISYMGAKLDATYALQTKKSGDHELKFGGEYRYHTLRKVYFSPIAVANNPKDSLGVTQFEPEKLWFGRDVLLNSYGYDVRDQYNNQIVSAEDIEAKHPVVAAAYLRDKIDFGDFTVNAGIRMDYLDVATDVIKDPKDLLGADGELLTADDYQKSEANITFSPRLGFSFPVTNQTVFTAQFGKFIQIPPLDYLYINKLAFKYFFSNSVQNVAENSALKPERLTSYEVGIKQQVGDFVNLGVSAYYKETIDQIGAYRINGSDKVPTGYATYFNSDFSVSRGLDFYLSMRRMNRLAVDIAYTLLNASGIGSDPQSKFTLANNPNAELPNVIFPLDYDQRHTGSVNLDYRFGGESDVPKGFGGKILQNLGMNVLLSFNSGRPYTVRTLPKTGFADDGDATSTKNGVYRGWNLKIDARLDKTVPIWKTNWNFYIYCTNLLNTEIINNVYGATGLPDDNGYLYGQGNSSTEVFKENWKDRIRTISNWGAPRQVQFGVKVNF